MVRQQSHICHSYPGWVASARGADESFFIRRNKKHSSQYPCIHECLKSRVDFCMTRGLLFLPRCCWGMVVQPVLSWKMNFDDVDDALPAFYGFISQRDRDRINAMFRKARRWGITIDEFDMDLLSTISDSGLFRKIGDANHCLHRLLPRVHEVPSYNLQPKPIVYNIPCPKLKNFSIHLQVCSE